VGLALLAAIAGTSELAAHRLDELLQAARIAIGPDRVELEIDVTPGVAIADTFLASIDRDRNQSLSVEEQRRFVDEALAAIALDVDGRALDSRAIACTFADVDAFRRGEGTIHLRAMAALPPLADGEHHLSLRNTFRPDLSVYLANALVPDSDRISITAQHRDIEQRDLTIDYVLRAAHTSGRVAWLSGLIAIAACAIVLLHPQRRRPYFSRG